MEGGQKQINSLVTKQKNNDLILKKEENLYSFEYYKILKKKQNQIKKALSKQMIRTKFTFNEGYKSYIYNKLYNPQFLKNCLHGVALSKLYNNCVKKDFKLTPTTSARQLLLNYSCNTSNRRKKKSLIESDQILEENVYISKSKDYPTAFLPKIECITPDNYLVLSENYKKKKTNIVTQVDNLKWEKKILFDNIKSLRKQLFDYGPTSKEKTLITINTNQTLNLQLKKQENELSLKGKSEKTKGFFLRTKQLRCFVRHINLLLEQLNNLNSDFKAEKQKIFDVESKLFNKKTTNEIFRNKKNITDDYKNIYYIAFDIETVNLEIPYELSDELIPYLGEPTAAEVISSLASNKGEKNVRIIQIPCLIGFTKLVEYENRESDTVKSDINRTKIFEISDLSGQPGEILKRSNIMLLQFWQALHAELAPIIEENNEAQKKKSKIVKNVYIFAHNLGAYDGIFLLRSYQQCQVNSFWPGKPDINFKDNKVIRMTISPGIKFLDSLQIMNSSLDNIAQTMLNKQKIDTGYKVFTIDLLKKWKSSGDNWTLFKQYLARDCTLLLDIIHKLAILFFENYKFLLGEKTTISSTATEIFLKNYYKPNSYLKKNNIYLGTPKEFYQEFGNTFIHSLTSEQDAFVRDSFIGGRTEVFEVQALEAKLYDINSAYNKAMADEYMPTGRGYGPYPVKDPVGFYYFELDNFFGFLEATVYSPVSLDPPVLPSRRKNGRIIFPCGTFTGKFFSEELKLAKKMGYIIVVHSTINFTPNKDVFKDFIYETYKNRLDYPKKTPQNLFFKTILVSVFGRFALNPSNEKVVFPKDTTELMKKITNNSYLDHHLYKDLNDQWCGVVKYSSSQSTNASYSKGSPFIRSFKAKQLKIAPQLSACISSYTVV